MKIINTKFKKALEISGKVAVVTEDGEKLIGIIGDPRVLASFNPHIGLNADQEGIWLRRERTITFLGDHTIKSIKKAKSSEKEINL